jgi:hypothetical protein
MVWTPFWIKNGGPLISITISSYYAIRYVDLERERGTDSGILTLLSHLLFVRLFVYRQKKT